MNSIINILPVAASTNFKQCMDDVRSGKFGSEGGTDSFGNPVSDISQATGITYGLCVRACGRGAEAFDLASFSQQFTAWLLPWLALISQLPFGARTRPDDLISIALTLGSPVLVAYSLALTVLNSHWLCEKFRLVNDASRDHVINVLKNLQQVPIVVQDGMPVPAVNGSHDPQQIPLQVLPGPVATVHGPQWWQDLADKLDYADTWSLATAVSVFWVVVAYLFTIVGAFGSQSFDAVQRRVGLVGYGVASLWLWLLPVVIGWQLISPRSSYSRTETAITAANGILRLDVYEQGSPGCDRECSPPVYNYARFLMWTRAVDDVRARFDPTPVRRGFWRWDVIWRFTIATALAFFLQWSTAMAAVLFAYFTPTRGMAPLPI